MRGRTRARTALTPMEPEFCRRDMLRENPSAWKVSVNGFLVDARDLPPEALAEAHRRGYITDPAFLRENAAPGMAEQGGGVA